MLGHLATMGIGPVSVIIGFVDLCVHTVDQTLDLRLSFTYLSCGVRHAGDTPTNCSTNIDYAATRRLWKRVLDG